MERGKVYIVGAGPGHPELLTIKAAELLKTCDVVVYDRLIQEEVLALAKPSAERLYMGKPLGKHDSRQDEIHELLVQKALEGKMVVRLKGGDPFVFGRGGEEVEYLSDHGVAFEVIPGVTSALAAPLSAGIAVTHRDSSSCVAVVTGHEAKKEDSRMEWEALSKIETLVVLMGVHNLAIIASNLIEKGKEPKTPAAVIQMAFWHDERVVTSTLENIAQEAERQGVRPPATLVVGEVVRLREKLKGAQRDLRRRADGSSRFEPAPAPDQLLRLATAGLGSQVLGFSLERKLFDYLETPKAPTEVCRELQLNAATLTEILDVLVALGVLEGGADGYRNLELASRYLRSDSPQSLRSALLHQTAQLNRWEALADYASRGCRDFIPSRDESAYRDSCEALACFAAPAVVEKLDLGGRGPVLLIGWGTDAYKTAVSQRWPEVRFEDWNPFTGGAPVLSLADEFPAGRDGYGSIILSGLLASSNRGQVQQILDAAASRLKAGGLLALHDSFLPSSLLPPPEVVLGSLGRRITRGGCRTWPIRRLTDSLGILGFEALNSESLPAGTVLVTATKC